MIRTRTAIATIGVLIVASLASACGGGSAGNAAVHGNTRVSGSITFDGIWTASSGQKQFQDVIDAFQKRYPEVHVQYKPVGNDLPTVLATAVAGGRPPDMADIAQPGTVKQFANEGKLKPITYASAAITRNFAPAWRRLGIFNKKLYALVFKAANKSLVWYNAPAFKTAGVKPPKTFAQLLGDAQTLRASGTRAYSIGGADGWTLTDLFENIYLRTFGPRRYDALAAHKIKWTDKSVTAALETMAKILGDPSNIAGGTSGALQFGFNDSVTNAFGTPSKAAMVFEGDFVGGVIKSSTQSAPGSGYAAFPFPAITPGKDANAVEIAGDLLVTFRDTPAIRAFVRYLATPQAVAIWARQGGFGSGNRRLSASVYPDPITRLTEAPILKARSVVFDLSDEQPPTFGSTSGQGEWALFQKFLENPRAISRIQHALESAAAAAYKSG